jgi:hypothetical protein
MSTKFIDRSIKAITTLVFLVGLVGVMGFTVQDGSLEQRPPVAVRVDAGSFVEAPALPEDAELGVVRVWTELRDVDAADNAWLLLARLPVLLVVVALVYLTLRFAVLVAARQPFHSQNILSMRIAAGLLLVSPLLKLMQDWIIREHLLSQAALDVLPLADLRPQPQALFGGLAVLLLAEAFAAGRRAEKNAEGLV